ncbi:MAG TPA: shikimate kinase [Candidatus Hydrogenedentes bacterium]|nr:shikimate kinase [Candidatus Hydrogenedentota bacterium]HOS02877.1 shikimate kinase [Candidatus Hydrogenedentota bacterium]
MNIVLIGYRGAGKSRVGKLVAAELGMTLRCTDEEIVRRIGCSIPSFVKKHGWDAFRDVETEVIRSMPPCDATVIDTGGGAVLRPENVAVLKACGPVFWLQASVDKIVARIQTDANRPSLTGSKSFTEEVAEVLADRLPIYGAAADRAIDTDDKTPEEVAASIIHYATGKNCGRIVAT